MLQHMFLGDPPGNYDRILDFSTAVTGSLFFVPTADFLDDPPPLPGAADQASPDESGGTTSEDPSIPSIPSGSADGSLGIGGLGDRSG
jgi:putative iron-dependent peroxidase